MAPCLLKLAAGRWVSLKEEKLANGFGVVRELSVYIEAYLTTQWQQELYTAESPVTIGLEICITNINSCVKYIG